MKYFEYSLWMDTKSADESKRQTALKIWEERVQLYAKEYLKAKESLAKTFVMTYEGNFGFRGCYLSDLLITADNKKDSLTCKLRLSDLIDNWQLTYSGLEIINYHPAGNNSPWVMPNGYTGLEYSELLPFKKDKLSHELLLSNGSTLLIRFSTVSVKKINEP